MDMFRKIIIRLFLPLLVIIVTLFVIRWYLLQPPADVTLENGARINWTSCWFDVPIDKVVYCAQLHPSRQNVGKTISLPVVVYKHYGLQHKPDPVLFINGGPGSANGLESDNWSYYIDGLDWQRDFIVFDHRGTGLSTPKPECPSLFTFYYEAITTNMAPKDEYRRAYSKEERCRRMLVEQGNELSGYSTLDNAQDIRDLMDVIDYPEWNLYGTSYGTRVALELMRDTPTSIRSVILDSVYPADKNSMLTWPSLVNNTMEMIFEYCNKKEKCRKAYPDLRGLFTKGLTELRRNPVHLNLPEFYSDGSLDIYVNDFRFTQALFMAMYSSELLATLPKAIDGAAYGAHSLMVPVMMAYADYMLDSSFNDAIYYSVECNDNKLITEEAFNAEVQRFPWLKGYHKYAWRYYACKSWSTGTNKKLSLEPVRSTIPTLILSGQYDPTTPWQWAKKVHKELANSFHFVFPDAAHGVLWSDECAVLMSRDFMSNPTVSPKQTCLTLNSNDIGRINFETDF